MYGSVIWRRYNRSTAATGSVDRFPSVAAHRPVVIHAETAVGIVGPSSVVKHVVVLVVLAADDAARDGYDAAGRVTGRAATFYC